MALTIQEEIDKYVNSSGFSAEDVKQSAIKLFRNFADIGNAVVSIVDNTGIAGFKFHLPESEQIKFQSDITDHYIDTNVAVQDHIAQKPAIVTLRGLQGDYFYSVHKLSDLISTTATTYKLVKEFLPSLTAHAKQALTNKWKNNPVSKFKTLSKTNNTAVKAYKKAVYTKEGFDAFIWKTVMDGRERERHAFLNGTTWFFDNPPVIDEEGNTGLPGEAYNCRCTMVPIISNSSMKYETQLYNAKESAERMQEYSNLIQKEKEEKERKKSM